MQEGANGPAESAASQQVITLGYYCNFAAVSYILLFFWGGGSLFRIYSKKKLKKLKKCPWHTNMETQTFSSFHCHLPWAFLPLGLCVHVMICKDKDRQAT